MVDAAEEYVRVLKSRVRLLGIAFFAVFVAFSAAQLLQTAINGSSGYLCLILIYVPFTLSAVLAPYLVAVYGPILLLPAAAGGYALFVASNILGSTATLLPGCTIVGLCASVLWSSQGTYVGRAAVALSKATNKPQSECASDLNGTFFAIFLSSGGVSSLFASAVMLSVTGADQATAVRLLFVLLTIAGVAGVLILALLPAPDSPTLEVISWTRLCCSGRSSSKDGKVSDSSSASLSDAIEAKAWDTSLATAAGGVRGSLAEAAMKLDSVTLNSAPADSPAVASLPSAASAASIKDTPPTADSEHAPESWTSVTVPVGEQPQPAEEAQVTQPPKPPLPPKPTDMLRFLVRERKLHLFAPAILYSGAVQGYLLGAWIATLVGEGSGLGPAHVGWVGSIYSFSCALSLLGWKKVASQPQYGRTRAFVVTCCLELVWLLLMAGWLHYVRANPPIAGNTQAGVPQWLSVTVVVVAIGVIGLVDSVWNGFVPATLQTYFPTGNDTPCAMAAIRICYSIGFSIQQVVSIGLGPTLLVEQALLLAAFLCCATASLYYLHTRVCSLDGVTMTEQPPGQAPRHLSLRQLRMPDAWVSQRGFGHR